MDSDSRVFYNGEKDRIVALGQSHHIFNEFTPLTQNVFDLHGQILQTGALSVSLFALADFFEAENTKRSYSELRMIVDAMSSWLCRFGLEC